MEPPADPSLSLRPFPVADRQPKNLADFIARVNAQPGGFRSLTDDALRQRARADEAVDAADTVDADGSPMSDEADDDDAPLKDPAVARLEVLKDIDIASNTAMLTLDSLSLLLSKQAPTQASVTLSQQLRDMVGIGTLGADKLDEPSVSDDLTKKREAVAVGWTLMEINSARAAAHSAAAFLEREVETESRYWHRLMSVKKAGWSICTVPHQRHTLAVRFGFPEAAPEFKNNGLAPIRRAHDGSVELDLGRLGGVSEGLVVTYERHGKVVGRSVPRRRRAAADPSLEAHVLEARNTIFAQELWHQLMREARTLAAYNVRLEASRLTCQVDEDSAVAIELLPLDSCPSPDETLPDNATADMMSLSLHILLSYAHRYNELTRTRPIPPHISRSRGQQTHALLRPIIARIRSILSTQACTARAGNLVKALQSAGLPSSLTLRTPQLSVAEPGARGPNQPSSAQTLVRSMLQPLEFTVRLTILADTWFTIRGRTFLFPFMATYYHVLLPPASPLQETSPPFPDGYSDLRSLCGYIETAVARTLAAHTLARRNASAAGPKWVLDVLGSMIHSAAAAAAAPRPPGMHVAVRDVDTRPTIVLTRASPGESVAAGQRRWMWTYPPPPPSEGAGAGGGGGQGVGESRTLDDVTDELAREVCP